MMKNKSTLAKLLAEEDIFVVHKKMDTAYFNPKSRELGLPIWKDEEMTKDIYDLMVCHEIAHALWTPLDMLETAAVRKINHSFVNIVEDARIERMVQDRYPGSVAVFNRGYRDLTAKDFFGIADKDVSELNLIDRINLFFKKQKVEFTAEEKVWVKRVAETKTPEDVLNLSEELYAWMAENAPMEDEDGEEKTMSDPNGESGDGEEGETILTAGAMMPLETLSLGWGDCDSKSLLFAALVRSINLAEVCFIVMDEHLFVGVQLSPNQDDQTIPHKGKDWILITI